MPDAPFWSEVPNTLWTFGACLLIGAFVIFKYCLDQFEKPVENLDDRWNFLVPSQLTPQRQYIIGFTIYYGLSMVLFLGLSFVGPSFVAKIAKGAGADVANLGVDLKDHSTFPIIVAFIMVGLYPNLRPPIAYDVEVWLRRIGHWMAYIPKNMVNLVNEMEFSGFDLAAEKVATAWSLIELKRPELDGSELKGVTPMLDRLVLLYTQGAVFAGDLELPEVATLRNEIDPNVFKEFHEKFTSVFTNLEEMLGRFEDLEKLDDAGRRQTIIGGQREINKALDVLYVIFACAITAKGADRLDERIRAIGFTSQFSSKQPIPWSPILSVIAPSAIALLIGLTMALKTFPGLDPSRSIPNTPFTIIQQVVLIVLTICLAVGNAVSIRARLINRDKYFAEKPAAYFKIAFRCFLVTLPCYLVIYLDQLSGALVNLDQDPLIIVGQYLEQFAIWPAVPAICGILVAVTLDRPANNHYERAISGAIQGAGLAIAAWLVVVLGAQGDGHFLYQVFILIVYGGFGFVIGANLPAAIRRYHVAQQNQMPQRVAALYNEVSRYFYDYGQFNEWLYARNPALGSKPPSDILLEETGMGRLITFVSDSRKQFAAQS